MRVPAEVIQIAIDDALKQASPVYESLAREHIPALEQAIQAALQMEGYMIVPANPPPDPNADVPPLPPKG
jgi:hypothetical protein